MRRWSDIKEEIERDNREYNEEMRPLLPTLLRLAKGFIIAIAVVMGYLWVCGKLFG